MGIIVFIIYENIFDLYKTTKYIGLTLDQELAEEYCNNHENCFYRAIAVNDEYITSLVNKKVLG